MRRTKRIAFDMHGVLDTFAHIRQIADMVYLDPYSTMIIISGQMFDKNMQETLAARGIKFEEYYSITQELLSKDSSLITWINGKPYAEDKEWNRAKADICKREGIEILYDDSTEYAEYFEDIPTTYVQIHNGQWKESGRESK